MGPFLSKNTLQINQSYQKESPPNSNILQREWENINIKPLFKRSNGKRHYKDQGNTCAHMVSKKWSNRIIKANEERKLDWNIFQRFISHLSFYQIGSLKLRKFPAYIFTIKCQNQPIINLTTT